MKRKTGLRMSAVSPMDYRIVSAAVLPESWTAPTLPAIGNQAVQNCLNWAVSYCHEMNTGIDFSKGYLYGERAASDWQGQGADIRQFLANALKYGNVPRVNWNREDEVNSAQQNVAAASETLRPIAAKYPVKAYYLCASENDVKTARMAGLGVIFGAMIDKYECKSNGVFKAVNGNLGAHAMTIIDWSKDYPALWRVANSWDSAWGVDGYCYMTTEDVMRSGMVYAVEFAQPLADCPNCPTDGIVVVPDTTEQTVTPIGRRTLKYTYPRMKDGDGYTDVSEFQALCNKIGIVTPIDGYYGTRARNACIKLQSQAFPDQIDEWDGVVAGNTWAALDELAAKAETETEVEDDEEPTIESSVTGQFVEWLKQQVGHMYLLGAQGEKIYDGMTVKNKVYEKAEDYIRYRERKSDSYFYKALAFYNILVSKGKTPILAYDCSGLLVCWLLKNKFIEQDMTAYGLYNLCKQRRAISTNWRDCKKGWLCFKRKWTGEVYHVGVYIGAIDWNGTHYENAVIESKSRADGVVIRDMREDGRLQWNCFGVLGVLDED